MQQNDHLARLFSERNRVICRNAISILRPLLRQRENANRPFTAETEPTESDVVRQPRDHHTVCVCAVGRRARANDR